MPADCPRSEFPARATGCPVVASADRLCAMLGRRLLWVVLALACLGVGRTSLAAEEPASVPPNRPASVGISETLIAGPKTWTSPEGLSSTLKVMLLLTVLSLAPAALLMTTCFVRMVVVLSLLRQAIGAQNLPPTQVITTLAMFLTLLVMTPVWKQVYDQAVVPYERHEMTTEQAWDAGVAPIRRFMSMQIERTRNTEDVWLMMSYMPKQPRPQSYDDVPLQALAPAFMLSELKTAFLIGFQIYLPFVILDMVVASVMTSMGMLMVPPALVSLPLKLLLFVLVDGWHLVVGMLMQSFQAFT
ncbi:MAG: flagellar type III secretion system pore protein FliP [Thermoguttaceae bacterium]